MDLKLANENAINAASETKTARMPFFIYRRNQEAAVVPVNLGLTPQKKIALEVAIQVKAARMRQIIDSILLSRHGKSSSELASVMI